MSILPHVTEIFLSSILSLIFLLVIAPVIDSYYGEVDPPLRVKLAVVIPLAISFLTFLISGLIAIWLP